MNAKPLRRLGLMLALACPFLRAAIGPAGVTVPLDGEDWMAAPDPRNVGREKHWFAAPRPEARPTRVPWTFPAEFVDYHGALWYWHRFEAPANPFPHGRSLIRFWSVHYRAEVWVNGFPAGSHDGADEPFVFDVTDALRPGRANLVAVRVLNPTKRPIDGLTISKVPHRWPTSDRRDFAAGGSVYNYGGILDSVELLVEPAVRIDDLHIQPDPKTGAIRVDLAATNAGTRTEGQLELTISEAGTGAIVASAREDRVFAPGENRMESRLTVKNPRLWALNDPYLYRVTARVSSAGARGFDQQSTRCGFRDFRIANGCFELNGKRIFLRSAHTGNGAPGGYVIPYPSDRDLLRRDLILAKTMGLNTLRFLAGMATRAEAPGAGRTDAAPGFTSRTMAGTGLGYYRGMGDVHIYPALPETDATLRLLRTVGQGTKPVFISEYGYDPALDLVQVTRQYEQLGLEDYNRDYLRSGLDRFMKDWNRWDLAGTFGRHEDYFHGAVAAQAGIRTEGINAIRSNPNVIGYNLTSLVDGYSGEGIITYFHGLKPGMTDAIADGFAPLRWCLFAGSTNVYRGGKIRLEAVLADEDALLPGRYRARFEVFGPDARRVFARTGSFAIADPRTAPRSPLTLNVFAEDVPADWPEGRYRFVATLEQGGAAAGGPAEFNVTDPAAMPAVKGRVVLWGDDPALAAWLAGHGVRTSPYSAAEPGSPSDVILAGRIAPAGGIGAFQSLAAIVRQGATAVFLDPDIFPGDKKGGDLSCLGMKGRLTALPRVIVIADYWAKRHPIFAGLTVSADRLGSGRIILSTLRIEPNLGTDPAAERLLRNLLRYAAGR